MSPEEESEFWSAVGRELGRPLPREIQEFLYLEGRIDTYRAAPDEAKRLELARQAAHTVRHLWSSGVTYLGREEVLEPRSIDDPRWQLLADLDQEYESVGADTAAVRSTWRPLWVVQRSPKRDYPFPSVRVVVDFDYRLSLSAIMGSLRELWPVMRQRGWVHATRPIDEGNLALVRFVCLETPPGSTWQMRLATWNSAHPERPFPDERRFQAAFRRAEVQLTEKRGGLAWFYDRTRVDSDQVLALVHNADLGLSRRLRHAFHHFAQRSNRFHRKTVEGRDADETRSA